jgi:hypothetical protein
MHLRDPSLFVDQVCDAPRVLIFGRVRRAVRQTDLVVGVAQQRKLEILLLRKFSVRFDGVEAGADDLRVL